MPDPGVESQPRRPGRQTAVVVIVLAAMAIVAAFADERLLVADPDPSAVTAGDVRLARSLLRGMRQLHRETQAMRWLRRMKLI